MFSRLISALLFLVVCVANVNAETTNGVGFKKLEVSDPVGQRPMDAVAFFPSPVESGVTSIGPYQIAASKSGVIGNDRYPLILLSHGNMGGMWGHHDLATFLAQRGYIVVSVTHPGDNFRDASGIGAVSTIYGRPMQISAALTAALSDPLLAAHVDADRIGFIGFSAGGTTGLILAGAKPTFTLLKSYCAKRPADRSVCEAQGRITTDRPELAPLPDPRIRSFVLLAPLSVLFAPAELGLIKIPALVFSGDKDEELSIEDNAMTLAANLRPDTELEIVPEAGHFTFLAPCSPELIRATPALCVDREGVDRVALHQQINAEIAAFFAKTLDSTLR